MKTLCNESPVPFVKIKSQSSYPGLLVLLINSLAKLKTCSWPSVGPYCNPVERSSVWSLNLTTSLTLCFNLFENGSSIISNCNLWIGKNSACGRPPAKEIGDGCFETVSGIGSPPNETSTLSLARFEMCESNEESVIESIVIVEN